MKNYSRVRADIDLDAVLFICPLIAVKIKCAFREHWEGVTNFTWRNEEELHIHCDTCIRSQGKVCQF